jgi:hypothetical protein
MGSHHQPAPSRNQWVDREDARDRALADKAEEIRARRDQLHVLEAELRTLEVEYASLAAWGPEPPRVLPPVDARTFPSAGSDEREAWGVA